MTFKTVLLAASLVATTGAVQADDSALALGQSAFGALCTNCHGENAKGGGEIGGLFAITPPDLTKLSKRAGGKFPFSATYNMIINGMKVPGHGPFEMPVWGDYFMADALRDRGLSKSDAIYVAAGRALAVTYYLESIQE